MTWPGSGTRSNSHSVAARSSCTTIPLASGGAQEDETILRIGFSKPWPGAVRPPPSAGTDQAPVDGGRRAAPCSGVLEDSPLDQNASRCILPERDQQLACQG